MCKHRGITIWERGETWNAILQSLPIARKRQIATTTGTRFTSIKIKYLLVPWGIIPSSPKKRDDVQYRISKMYKHSGIIIRERGETWMPYCSPCHVYLQVGRKTKLVFFLDHMQYTPSCQFTWSSMAKKIRNNNCFGSVARKNARAEDIIYIMIWLIQNI